MLPPTCWGFPHKKRGAGTPLAADCRFWGDFSDFFYIYRLETLGPFVDLKLHIVILF